MQFSLTLLHEQLSKRPIAVSPLHGEDVLFKTPRFAKAPEEPESGVLYLFHSESNITLVQSCHSYFTVSLLSYPETCSLIIDICQKYDQWEKDLHEMVWDNTGFQKIIDRTDIIFDNPIFLSNWQGNVLGYSQKYKDADIMPFWHTVTHENRVPIYCLAIFLESDYRNVLLQENDVHLLDYPEYEYKSLFGLIHVNHEIVLQFQIIEYNHPLTLSDQFLARIFLNTLRISFRENHMSLQESAMNVFKKLIQEEQVKKEALQWTLDYLGWQNPETAFYLIDVIGENGNAMFPQIERYLPGCRIINLDGKMIILIPVENFNQFHDAFSGTLDYLHLYGGVSLPFHTWDTLPISLDQAQNALKYCSKEMPLSFSSDHILDQVITLLSSQSENLIHPAVSVLKDFDQTNGTDLARTLYVYLSHERNNNETAEALYIHRNTLKYRIDRINQLIHADLNDPDTRMHILLSFKMDKPF